jgi:hypothetical protein
MSNAKHPTADEYWQSIKSKMEGITERSPVKVFLASFTWECFVPFRLVNVRSIRDAPVQQSLELILDSGIRNEDVGNREIIETFLEYEDGVDWVIPKDYPNDRQRTVESVLAFFKLADTLAPQIKNKVIIPIQGVNGEDYLGCWRDIQSALGLPEDQYVGLGGIAGSDITRVKSMSSVQQKREAVMHVLDNSEVRMHLFGQTNFNWTDIYHHEQIVSCDSSKFGHGVHYECPRGKGGSQIHAWLEAGEYYKFVMMISDGYTPQGKKPKQHDFGGFFDGSPQ